MIELVNFGWRKRRTVRPHLPEEELHAWLDSQLSPSQGAEIAEHLLACLVCRALEAEVRVLRARAETLLAVAVPRTPSRVVSVPQVRRRRILSLRPAAAAALAVITVGTSWLAFGRAGTTNPDGSPNLASVVVAPAILAAINPGSDAEDALGDPDAISADRNARLAATVRFTPRVVGGRAPDAYTLRPMRTMDPMSELSPSTSGIGWQNASYQEARAESGTLAHLEGVSVSTVRLQPRTDGARPTAMVRQVLPDGRAVWVIEGTEAEVQDVALLLEASGLTISQTRRSVPDYIGSEAEPVRSLRVVTVAAYLPYDSLQTLSTRLRLD